MEDKAEPAKVDNTANGVPAPVAASTTSSTAPTTTTTTPTPAPTSTTTTTSTTPTVTSIDTGTMPADFTCPGGTHPLDRGRNSACEVDNPAVRPGHAMHTWPDGGWTEVASYRTYFSTNGEPYSWLGNGSVNGYGDGVTYHRSGSHGGYFKIAGSDGRGYCIGFWVDPERPGKPAQHRAWDECRSDQ